ncbi:MAG: class I SAM-dependent methyltransferase [Polyangiaceae bacterium]|nr:class I SAM-dependent methyltransferase [Polyangiaceae bacterium]
MTQIDASRLDHYRDALLYEIAFRGRKADVSYFVEIANRAREQGVLDGPIIEWGAGTGRVSFALARAGHNVLAIDASKNMLHRLQEKKRRYPRKVGKRVQPLFGDMRSTKIDFRSGLILGTFNVVAHLAAYQDAIAFFRNSKDHLTEGGLFAFDVPLPLADEVHCEPGMVHHAPKFKHPQTKEWIRHQEIFHYDAFHQVLAVKNIYTSSEGDELTVPLNLRQWFPRELEAALNYAGFSHVQTTADYTDLPGQLCRDSLVYHCHNDHPQPAHSKSASRTSSERKNLP